MNADLAAPVPFDALRQQLDAACVAHLATAPRERINAALPAVALKRQTLTIELGFVHLARDAFFGALEVLGQYYRALSDVRKSYGGLTLVADAYSPLDRRSNERRRSTDPSVPELSPPTKVTFRFDDRKGSGAIVFEKDALLTQSEANCVVELWKRWAIGEATAVATDADPRAALESLGAVVYEASGDFGDSRIAGYEATKRDVRESIVMPLLHPEIFAKVGELARTRPGATVPRAVLFEGPPGTGKTTMARVIASEAKLPLVYVPVESIMSKWYGDSEKRLDAIFDAAGRFSKSIVFLDEIDAFAGSREGPMHEGTRRILSVLLRQLQGLVDTSNVVVIGATNRKEDLDPALLSRFTRSVTFPLPNDEERRAIVGYYARHLDARCVTELVRMARGRSGREIEDACGVAERAWASQLVATAAPASAPPGEAYVTAFRVKFAAGAAG